MGSDFDLKTPREHIPHPDALSGKDFDEDESDNDSLLRNRYLFTSLKLIG